MKYISLFTGIGAFLVYVLLVCLFFEIWQCKDCTRRIALVPNEPTIIYNEGMPVKHWLDLPGRHSSVIIKKK